MKSNQVKYVLLGSVLALSACGGKGGGGDSANYGTFSDKVLAGKVAGHDWTFQSGNAKPSSNGQIWINLWDSQVAEPCAFAQMGSDRAVITTVDPKVGLVNMGMNDNITLVDHTNGANDNHAVMNGAYEITEITDDHVTGRIAGGDGADNTVNGTFTVPRCAN